MSVFTIPTEEGILRKIKGNTIANCSLIFLWLILIASIVVDVTINDYDSIASDSSNFGLFLVVLYLVILIASPLRGVIGVNLTNLFRTDDMQENKKIFYLKVTSYTLLTLSVGSIAFMLVAQNF